jgi:hypothetical protein
MLTDQAQLHDIMQGINSTANYSRGKKQKYIRILYLYSKCNDCMIYIYIYIYNTRKYRTKTRMVPIIVSTWSWHDRWWVLNDTLLQINMSVPPENSESRWCVLVALTYEHRAHLVTWENNYNCLLNQDILNNFYFIFHPILEVV